MDIHPILKTSPNAVVFLLPPFLILRDVVLLQHPQSHPVPYETRLFDSLAVLGWLLVSLLVLTTVKPRQTPRTWQLVTAALGLALLRAVRLLWADSNLEGALTVAEPLLIVWPYITPAIPPQITKYLLGAALYTITLILAAFWRVSRHSAAIAIPVDTPIIWMLLALGAVAIGQFLLWKQRLWLLRSALILLAVGAMLATFGTPAGETVVVLLALLLALVQFCHTSRSPTSETEPSATDQPATGTGVSPAPTPVPEPAPRYLYEKRQLLSMRLASIVAYEGRQMTTLLSEMLQTFTAIVPADVAHVLLAQADPTPGLVAASRYASMHSSNAICPTALDQIQAPVLFHALLHGQTLLFSQQEWGESPILDTLYHALGEAQPGPTVIQPVTRGERGYGLLVVGNPYSKQTLSEDDSCFCQVLAARIGGVVARDPDAVSFSQVSKDENGKRSICTAQAVSSASF